MQIESLRLFFTSKMNPIILIDFGQNLVFDSAIVHTNIVILKKEDNLNSIIAVRFDDEDNPANFSLDKYLLENGIKNLKLDSKIWNIIDNKLALINEKSKKFKRLKDFEININFGIKTGFNEAFIIDNAKYKELIQKDPKNSELLKPILRGRDTRRYYYKKSNLFVISTFPALNISIDNYPFIKEYLSNYLPKLNQTGEFFKNKEGVNEKTRKKTPNKWFEVQDSVAFYKDFIKPKIVFSEIVSEPQFFYDEENYYPEATVFFISGEKLKYLTALLNSKFVTFLFKNFYMGGDLVGKIRYKKVFLEQVPIPYPEKNDENEIEEKVDKILSIKKENPNTDISILEKEIDQMVYQLYGLTQEEIAIVENS